MNSQLEIFSEARVPGEVTEDFQTPTPVCRLMVSMVPFGVKRVLEPTPGVGNLVRCLSEYEVVAPYDYFLMKRERFDCVVMNPPFSTRSAFGVPSGFEDSGMRLGYEILRECMTMSDNVIALMPWFTLIDSDHRMRDLKKYGIVSITSLPRKTFKYARIQTCVLNLRKGFREETVFKVFNY